MKQASQKREQRTAVNADSVSTPHVQATRQREKVKLKFNNSKYHNKSISPLIAAKFNTLKGSRTVEANVARRALINTYRITNTSHTRRSFQRKFGVSWSQPQKSRNNNDIQVYIGHTKKHNGSHLPTSANTKHSVSNFYNADTVSRILPDKKCTVRINNERVVVRVMEITLNAAFRQLARENPNIKIARETF